MKVLSVAPLAAAAIEAVELNESLSDALQHAVEHE